MRVKQICCGRLKDIRSAKKVDERYELCFDQQNEASGLIWRIQHYFTQKHIYARILWLATTVRMT
jgi:hypothetical protein